MLTPRGAWQLLRQSIRRGRRAFLLSVFGIAVGIASLSFFLALSAGVRGRVLARVFPPGRLEVVPARSSLDGGPLGGLGDLFGSGPRPLTDETVAALRALPGVAAVAPRMKAAFPVRGWGGEGLLGRPVYTELIVDGVDPQAVTDKEHIGPLPFADLAGQAVPKSGDRKAPVYDDSACAPPAYRAWDINRCELPVPVIVSPLLLQIYNTSIAKAHNLPRIGDFLASRLRGFPFTAELGKSFMSGRAIGTPRQRRLMLVGISDAAMPLGLTVPLPYVRRWNAEYAGPRAAAEYSSVTVTVRPGGSVTAVADAARKLGLRIEDTGAEQAGLAVTLLTAVLVLVSLGIMVVATVNIAHTFFRAVSERRREIGVMRAVGATAADVQALLLCEAVAVGLCGGAAGLLFARLAALGVDWAARRWLPDFPFRPDSYFAFPAGLCLGVMGFSLLSCLAGAYLPARAAARLSPATALSGA